MFFLFGIHYSFKLFHAVFFLLFLVLVFIHLLSFFVRCCSILLSCCLSATSFNFRFFFCLLMLRSFILETKQILNGNERKTEDNEEKKGMNNFLFFCGSHDNECCQICTNLDRKDKTL